MKQTMKKWTAGVAMATMLGLSVVPASAATDVASTDLTLPICSRYWKMLKAAMTS